MNISDYASEVISPWLMQDSDQLEVFQKPHRSVIFVDGLFLDQEDFQKSYPEQSLYHGLTAMPLYNNMSKMDQFISSELQDSIPHLHFASIEYEGVSFHPDSKYEFVIAGEGKQFYVADSRYRTFSYVYSNSITQPFCCLVVAGDPRIEEDLFSSTRAVIVGALDGQGIALIY